MAKKEVHYDIVVLPAIPYQLCPKCDGSKQMWNANSTIPIECDVCEGEGIIPMFILPAEYSN